ncbi:MAG: right-handed parallel beta-helix repeat-containing protein [Gemmatimonadetes bacterium]|nr:right-handed parallel beta-helix repeat-containing protein [Gemmatimonadota bacterium]
MRARIAATAISLGAAALFVLGACTGPQVPTVEVSPDRPLASDPPAARGMSNLQRAIAGLEGPAIVSLARGHYDLLPAEFTDSSCGNCEDPTEHVPATVGLVVQGIGIRIVGADPRTTIIHTGAGYGILFDGCDGCALERVTVTGGVRDPDGRATDAAVVVRDGAVELSACRIADNIGDSATVARVVVGIAGVVGRERASIDLHTCEITRNSWDGVALYRGAVAEIRDNVIDGVDKARGAQVGGGRGVGIGLTWDARATVERNLVTRYWKGIGVFVDAQATVRENVVEDMLTWGIAFWGAGDGRPVATIERNVIFGTGACGVMIAVDSVGAEPPGALLGNLLIQTGQDERYDSGEPYCTQRPVALEAVPEGFVIANNVFHDNRQPGDAPRVQDVDRDGFLERARALLASLRQHSALHRAVLFQTFPIP